MQDWGSDYAPAPTWALLAYVAGQKDSLLFCTASSPSRGCDTKSRKRSGWHSWCYNTYQPTFFCFLCGLHMACSFHPAYCSEPKIKMKLWQRCHHSFVTRPVPPSWRRFGSFALLSPSLVVSPQLPPHPRGARGTLHGKQLTSLSTPLLLFAQRRGPAPSVDKERGT